MQYNETKAFWNDKENHENYVDIEKRLTEKIKAIELLQEQEENQALMEWMESNTDISKWPSENGLNHGHGSYVLSTDRPVYFIGDIHSDDEILDRVVDMIDPYNRDIIMVFLGDYVDRGGNHLGTLDKLYALKVDLPYQIILLRGNHDSGYLENHEVKLEYRQDPKSETDDFFPLYLDRLRQEGKISEDFMETYFTFSRSLMHIAYIRRGSEWFMGVHGGIPRPRGEENFYDYLPSLSSLADESIVDHIDRSVIKNMLWSDPREGDGEVIDKGRFSTYEKHFNAFAKRFGIAKMFRGHVAEKEGHKGIYDNRVYTVFSSGGRSKTTAYDYVTTPKVVKTYGDGQVEVVEIE